MPTPQSVTVTINPDDWQFALAAFNAKQAQLSPPPPAIDLPGFVQMICDNAAANNVTKAKQAHIAVVQKASLASLERFTKVLNQPQDVQDKLAATVDALPDA